MTRLFRWLFYGFVLMVLLVVAGILLMDTVARSAVESQIRAKTGMDVKIGKLTIGLASPTISIEDFKLFNTAEFGGSPFIQMPELYLEYDRESLRSRRLHFKLVRLNLAEISIVQDKKGRFNYAVLQEKSKKTADKASPMEFAGIDTMNITLQTARFTTMDSPSQDRQINFGIKNQIFHKIKSEKDLQSVALILAAKSGGGLLDQILASPKKAEQPGPVK